MRMRHVCVCGTNSKFAREKESKPKQEEDFYDESTCIIAQENPNPMYIQAAHSMILFFLAKSSLSHDSCHDTKSNWRVWKARVRMIIYFCTTEFGLLKKNFKITFPKVCSWRSHKIPGLNSKYSSGFRWGGKITEGHLLFADYSLLFCGAKSTKMSSYCLGSSWVWDCLCSENKPSQKWSLF